jgi:hypothetical protein
MCRINKTIHNTTQYELGASIFRAEDTGRGQSETLIIQLKLQGITTNKDKTRCWLKLKIPHSYLAAMKYT